MANENLLRTWANQLRGAVLASSGTQSVAEWLIHNTTDPRDPLQNWSFAGHEWQIGCLEALKTKNHIAIQKSAQVGASELSARMALALTVVGHKAKNLIYTLPSAGFAKRFVGSRVDPVIKNSPLLRTLLNSDFDNLEVKGIGASFIFFAGASVENQAISTPCDVLIVDEYNFSDEGVISVFASRLRHCKPGEEIVVNLSTPTLPSYGISKLYEQGDCRSYLVKHDKCGEWVEALPDLHIEVPGWSGTLMTLTKRELEQSNSILPEKAWVKCSHCGEEITVENLANPAKRQWVEKYPERTKASFHVSPLDCPVINPPSKIAAGVREFPRHIDFLNYGLGVPAASSDAMLMSDVLERSRVEAAIHPNVGASGCVAGLDVGKISHLTIAKKVNGALSVVWLERILQDGSGNLQQTVMDRLRQFGVARLVVDSQPDLSVPRQLISSNWAGRVLAAYFVTGAGPKSLDLVQVDERDGVVKINRTRLIDEFVRELNSGGVRLLAEHPDADMFIRHLMQLRRVEESGVEGTRKAKWVSISDTDHYFFSCLYAFTAAHTLEESSTFIPEGSFSASKLVSKVKLRLV